MIDMAVTVVIDAAVEFSFLRLQLVYINSKPLLSSIVSCGNYTATLIRCLVTLVQLYNQITLIRVCLSKLLWYTMVRCLPLDTITNKKSNCAVIFLIQRNGTNILCPNRKG